MRRRHKPVNLALLAEVHGWSWLALEQFTYAVRPVGSGISE